MSRFQHGTRRAITAASAAIALALIPLGGMTGADAVVTAGNPVVFDASVSPLPGNIPSLGYQATQTAEFGDAVQLAGTNRMLHSATVTMSTWALQGDYPSPSADGWTHPITFNVYNVVGSGAATARGALIHSITKDVTIPWRPAANPSSCPAVPTAWYSTAEQKCYNGLAFNVTFDLSAFGTVPDRIIYGVAYNTNTWGAAPIGSPGPYESLNVGLRSDGATTTGLDLEPDAVFWNTATASNYTDGGTTGTFRRDTGWASLTPAVSLTATAGGDCLFSQSDDTITLLENCTTDETILIPNDMTLDGAGHTITAVDPTDGHFLGAVVRNAGSLANVRNLHITADLATACDAFPDSLAGIRLDGASGDITNNVVTGLQQGVAGDGCQEGDAIEVRNTTPSGTPSVTVTHNTVIDYQKTGVLVTGKVSAVVTHNTVDGVGPVDYIAQNGIQISGGATARIGSNTISDNSYTPKSYTACGLIIYKAGGVLVEKTNTYNDNEKDVCTYGKGGTFNAI